LTHRYVFGCAMGAAVDFFNQVNLLFGTLTEFCTPENCPTMSAGPKYIVPLVLEVEFFTTAFQQREPQDATLNNFSVVFVNVGQI